jgi:hypothetical protein
MRIISIAAAMAAALALAAFDAPRAAGAYSSQTAENSEACARMCAADTLCMSWSYAENLCALRANVPQSMSVAASGLSPRAPQALRQTANAAPAQSTAATPPAIAALVPTARSAEPVETAMLLLGGPDEELDGAVRR